jgi:hypothetical protein
MDCLSSVTVGLSEGDFLCSRGDTCISDSGTTFPAAKDVLRLKVFCCKEKKSKQDVSQHIFCHFQKNSIEQSPLMNGGV